MKKLLGIILAVTALLTLAACGDGGKHEHSLTRVAAKAATCAEAGNNEYWTCSDCNKAYADEACTTETTVAAQAVAAIGHAWAQADCNTPKTCSGCHATEGEALGHAWSGACDASCNRAGCDEARVAGSHLDSDENDVCDNCGEPVSSQIPGAGTADGTELPKDEF